jgi:DNA-binding transcriptional MerR regulator
MTSHGVPIGVASARSGVKVPTIRYYEEIGLLPKPPRTKTNRRNYNAADLRRLVFIRHARELGFEIDAIRALLTLQDNPDQSCVAADVIARARLCEVERRIDILIKLKAELEHMIAECSHGCRMPRDRGACKPQLMAGVSVPGMLTLLTYDVTIRNEIEPGVGRRF